MDLNWFINQKFGAIRRWRDLTAGGARTRRHYLKFGRNPNMVKFIAMLKRCWTGFFAGQPHTHQA
jgi:hypothetical protein